MLSIAFILKSSASIFLPFSLKIPSDLNFIPLLTESIFFTKSPDSNIFSFSSRHFEQIREVVLTASP